MSIVRVLARGRIQFVYHPELVILIGNRRNGQVKKGCVVDFGAAYTRPHGSQANSFILDRWVNTIIQIWIRTPQNLVVEGINYVVPVGILISVKVLMQRHTVLIKADKF